MLEHYLVRPASADRIRALWLGQALSRYAEWLVARQAAKATAVRALRVCVDFNQYVLERGARHWDELPAHVNDFVEYRLKKNGKWCRNAHDRGAVRSQSRSPVEQLLSLLIPGFQISDRRTPWPLQAGAPGLLAHLRDERGLRPATLDRYRHHLRALEHFLQKTGRTDLSTLSPPILTEFLMESGPALRQGRLQGRAGTLRVLLRFLHRQGILDVDLSRAIPRGRKYRAASIPRAIPWSEVQRVLASIDRRSALGKRDYAMLMLLATYGLRAQEVGALELASIDWRGSLFHVLSRKAGNSTTYPLAASVGEAIIDYLRNARPDSPDRHVFLTVAAPFRRLHHYAVSTRAGIYLRRAGIKVRRPGSHTFRHSCVQRLVDADVPFKVIGDYVGHRSEQATQIYAKVALHKLRALTLGDAEEAL